MIDKTSANYRKVERYLNTIYRTPEKRPDVDAVYIEFSKMTVPSGVSSFYNAVREAIKIAKERV